MKMKKIIAMALALVLVAGLSIGGTVAYLQDEDSDVNVMTLGNVKIEQIEKQWNSEKTALVDFTQNKPLYPYVGTLGWDTNVTGGDAYRRFTMNNVVDKYVSVTNTGESDAYVRTVFAFEMGEFDTVDDFYYKVLGTSTNAENGGEFKFPGTWVWGDKFVAEINGHNYMIMVAVHKNPLAPNATTIPSLLQVYMKDKATNEDCKKIDGNKNDKYDILVLSQAVQAAGFENAQSALDTAFGNVNQANVQAWFASIGQQPVNP